MGDDNNREENQNIEFLNVTGRGRLHSWVGVGNIKPIEKPTNGEKSVSENGVGNDKPTEIPTNEKTSVSESGIGNDKPIEITINGKKPISESANKKRPRIKTHAKSMTHAKTKSMIQVRQNYMKRTEPESENEVTDVFEDIEETEDDKDRSPKSKKRDTINEKHIKATRANKINNDSSDRSPKAKKQRKEDIEELYWSIEAVSALKEIESLAENSETIDLIKCFDAESAETNCFSKTKENIRECTRTWNEKELKMRNAIKFIENDDKTDNLDSIKFEELITCLIITINNRMPKKCNDCNELYIVHIHTQPILRCMICNVGMHDCKNKDNKEIVSGILWMCPCCSSIGIENKVFDNAKMQVISKIISRKNTERKRANKRRRIQDEFNDIVVEAEIHVRDQNAYENSQDRRNMGKSKSKANEVKVTHEKKDKEQSNYEERKQIENNNEEPKRKMDKVCTYWARGICKFHTNCHYAHPVLCTVIMEKGTCQKGDNCEFFHPNICRDMKQTGHCHRGERCYFTHFKEAQSRPMYNMNRNQRDHSFQQNGNNHQNHNQQWNTNTGHNNGYDASRNNHQNHNQQWNQNTGHNNGYDAYNQMQGHHMDFYMNQNQNWKAMNKPIMERAAEILAEKMWGNQ